MVIRANKVKAEFQDAENLKVKLDHKEDDIRELKKALKLKAEELSAQHVRVGMVRLLYLSNHYGIPFCSCVANSSRCYEGNECRSLFNRQLDALLMFC